MGPTEPRTICVILTVAVRLGIISEIKTEYPSVQRAPNLARIKTEYTLSTEGSKSGKIVFSSLSTILLHSENLSCLTVAVISVLLHYKHNIWHLALWIKISANNIWNFFFLFFYENRFCHFIQIVSIGEICKKCQVLLSLKNNSDISCKLSPMEQ